MSVFLNLCLIDKYLCFFVNCDQIGNRGTVTEAAGFDPEADVKTLREAMKGAGE